MAPVLDSMEVRFGLRLISIGGNQNRSILLNGKPIKLKGVNRHEFFPNLGPALPQSQYKADIALLQTTLNANFVRGAHYPQDERFLDLCDERGVLVWAEALGWNNSVQQMNDTIFMDAQIQTVNAMVDTHFNHPSVILWGFFNEGESDSNASRLSYARMAGEFRRRDRMRLVTWGNHKKERDVNLELADVVSFNHYPGWYGHYNWTMVKRVWRRHATWVLENFPGKPFLISEAGADGFAGNHKYIYVAGRGSEDYERLIDRGRGSEEYERLIDGMTADIATRDSRIAGISLWQFTDIKVDEDNSSLHRPGGLNSKGLFDMWRHPKLAAGRVGKLYRDQGK
eukprot:gnl/TRDRNA2_/TRDRNA2_158579_c2_seq1.p1 gnl/TRDRNA2_/TRDRNA2_158579_c2~~gnl/TRDRNA2_/TRDRNA2_158579_c2_seq1.p1  ORF type:complete len:377 (+),score=14.98 gnl/TRDRNA2_/TRDRNA2_158579_c2_seq1:112-1131(+)